MRYLKAFLVVMGCFIYEAPVYAMAVTDINEADVYRVGFLAATAVSVDPDLPLNPEIKGAALRAREAYNNLTEDEEAINAYRKQAFQTGHLCFELGKVTQLLEACYKTLQDLTSGRRNMPVYEREYSMVECLLKHFVRVHEKGYGVPAVDKEQAMAAAKRKDLALLKEFVADRREELAYNPFLQSILVRYLGSEDDFVDRAFKKYCAHLRGLPTDKVKEDKVVKKALKYAPERARALLAEVGIE